MLVYAPTTEGKNNVFCDLRYDLTSMEFQLNMFRRLVMKYGAIIYSHRENAIGTYDGHLIETLNVQTPNQFDQMVANCIKSKGTVFQPKNLVQIAELTEIVEKPIVIAIVKVSNKHFSFAGLPITDYRSPAENPTGDIAVIDCQVSPIRNTFYNTTDINSHIDSELICLFKMTKNGEALKLVSKSKQVIDDYMTLLEAAIAFFDKINIKYSMGNEIDLEYEIPDQTECISHTIKAYEAPVLSPPAFVTTNDVDDIIVELRLLETDLKEATKHYKKLMNVNISLLRLTKDPDSLQEYWDSINTSSYAGLLHLTAGITIGLILLLTFCCGSTLFRAADIRARQTLANLRQP